MSYAKRVQSCVMGTTKICRLQDSNKPVSNCKFVRSHCKRWCLQAVEGLVETSPGVRSCMIEYDQRVLPLSTLLHILLKTEQQLPKVFAK